MIDWPRRGVMGHLQQPNYALCIGRAGLVTSGTWDLAFCVNRMCDHNLFYRGSCVNFPLYLYPDPNLPSNSVEQESRRRPNLSASFIKAVCETLKLRFVADQPGNLRATVGAENILHYAYALFYAPTYRQRYAEFLKYDFPRLPLTADAELFRALVIRGEQLVRLHVGEKGAPTVTHFPIKGANNIEKICYVGPGPAGGKGRLWINANQYFSDVTAEMWQFRIGGYEICRKWLSDRKGGRLSAQEQACYVSIVNVLSETVRLMHDIDGVIEQHGGWPIQVMKPVVTPPESTRRLAAKPHTANKASAVPSPAQAVLDSCLSYT
jgi:hypothetical protein